MERRCSCNLRIAPYGLSAWAGLGFLSQGGIRAVRLLTEMLKASRGIFLPLTVLSWTVSDGATRLYTSM